MTLERNHDNVLTVFRAELRERGISLDEVGEISLGDETAPGLIHRCRFSGIDGKAVPDFYGTILEAFEATRKHFGLVARPS